MRARLGPRPHVLESERELIVGARVVRREADGLPELDNRSRVVTCLQPLHSDAYRKCGSLGIRHSPSEPLRFFQFRSPCLGLTLLCEQLAETEVPFDGRGLIFDC